MKITYDEKNIKSVIEEITGIKLELNDFIDTKKVLILSLL